MARATEPSRGRCSTTTNGTPARPPARAGPEPSRNWSWRAATTRRWPDRSPRSYSPHDSDDVREALQTAKINRVIRLNHTWRFDDVPTGPHSLIIEGFRPANSAGDNFQFSWSANNVTYASIPGASVNSGTEARVEVPFAPDTLGRTVFIRVENTVTSGTKNRSLQIDDLAIKVMPSP
jgi:hypothetical protein